MTSGPLVPLRPKYNDIPPSHVEQSNSDAIYDFVLFSFSIHADIEGIIRVHPAQLCTGKNKSYHVEASPMPLFQGKQNRRSPRLLKCASMRNKSPTSTCSKQTSNISCPVFVELSANAMENPSRTFKPCVKSDLLPACSAYLDLM